ncbi:MAG: hypothetical protein IT422_16460 [Pirellulaceae bacterium]|nr:hypothetical protein [Pirellulaceae bacterium]
MSPLLHLLATSGGQQVKKWSGWGDFVVFYSKNLAHARQAGMGSMPNRDVW